jgi:hypothetical protein
MLGVMGIAIAIAMLFWQWKLVVATSLGVLVMRWLYCLQELDWQSIGSSLRQYLIGANRKFAIAVCIGSLFSLGIYVAISIGADTQSLSITIGILLQAIATLSSFILLLWQVFGHTAPTQATKQATKIDNLFADLTHTDPLKRLIAVRQLTDLATNQSNHSIPRISITDCFRLMLKTESEPIVLNAVLAGLQQLETTPKINQSTASLSPLNSPQEARAKTKLYSAR